MNLVMKGLNAFKMILTLLLLVSWSSESQHDMRRSPGDEWVIPGDMLICPGRSADLTVLQVRGFL